LVEMKSVYKQASILVAGALLSVAATLAVDLPNRGLLFILFFILTLLCSFLGFGVFGFCARSIKHWKRKHLKIRIAILYDMGWGQQAHTSLSAGTDIEPRQWRAEIYKQALEDGLHVEVDLIDSKADFEPFCAVVNPYGGVYPEYDLNERISLEKIFDYVANGGVFFNVADIPGFWLYNPRLSRRLHAAPAIHNLNIQNETSVTGYEYRPPSLVPFLQRLAIGVNFCDRMFSLTISGLRLLTSLKIVRMAKAEGNIFPLWWQAETMESPLFTIPYERGKFLISLIWVDETNIESEKIMKLLIKSLLMTISEVRTKKTIITTDSIILVPLTPT
jgi:hypothetical protein